MDSGAFMLAITFTLAIFFILGVAFTMVVTFILAGYPIPSTVLIPIAAFMRVAFISRIRREDTRLEEAWMVNLGYDIADDALL